MSVRDLKDVMGDPHAEMRQQLVAEWQAGDHTGLREPLILLDEPKPGRPPIRVYVVWQAWQGLPQRDRSRVIMQAFQAIEQDEERIRNVTIAMGLTPSEAERLGIAVA